MRGGQPFEQAGNKNIPNYENVLQYCIKKKSWPGHSKSLRVDHPCDC
jgi:hypothetical protein